MVRYWRESEATSGVALRRAPSTKSLKGRKYTRICPGQFIVGDGKLEITQGSSCYS